MHAIDYREAARDRLEGHWWLSIGAALVAALLGGSITGTNLSFELNSNVVMNLPETLAAIYMMLIPAIGTHALAQFILGGPISVGNAQYLLNQQDGQPLQLKTLFSKFEQFGPAFCMTLLTTIYTVLWSLLLLIPGIVASYSYAMAPFIMAENPGMKARDAIRSSKELMKGHKWALFCLDLSFIGWILLSILTMGIGMIFVYPYQSAARAAFYRSITESREQ